MNKTSIVLAMKHTLIRQALRVFLENSYAFTVLNESDDRDDISKMISDTRPNILLVDVGMLAFDGITFMSHLAKQHPGTRIVVMSLFGKDYMGVEWLRHGAAAYVFGANNAPNLICALKTVMEDEEQHAAESEQSYCPDHATPKTLTPREREVLLLAAEGYTNVEIGQRLSISSRTVEGHRARGMRRLRLRTPADLIRYALQNGLIPD